jgi:hypothetical protein
MPDKNSLMKPAARILFLGAIALGGCHTAHDVAVTSFRVIDAPANYVRRHLDSNSNTTTTTTRTTTTAESDAVTPGHTVNPTPPPRDTTKRRTTQETARPSPSPNASASPRVTRTDKTKPSPTPAPKSTTTQAQFPTARPVPNKPGYVFSPFDPSGGYVDVTGYASGSKVKDPYSGKIFLVP